MRAKKLFFDLHFNILDESFSYWKKITMQGKPEWIPVTEFFQQGFAEFLQARIADGEEAKELYVENLERLNKLDALRNYPYYVTTLTEGNMERVVEIFNLVNSAGTRLSKSDLALAHICASWPEAREIVQDGTEPHSKVTASGLTLTSSPAPHPQWPHIRLSMSRSIRPLPPMSRSAWKKVERVLDHLSQPTSRRRLHRLERDAAVRLPVDPSGRLPGRQRRQVRQSRRRSTTSCIGSTRPRCGAAIRGAPRRSSTLTLAS